MTDSLGRRQLQNLQNRVAVPDDLFTVSTATGLTTREARNEEHYYQITPAEAIPANRILTVNTGIAHSNIIAKANSLKPIKGDYRIYLSSGRLNIGTGGNAFQHLIGTQRPQLMTYTGTDPVLGQQIGPDANAYTATVKGEGLHVVADPDTTNKLAWVTRYIPDTDIYLMELVSAQMMPCNSGAPTGVDAYLTKWDPVTCAYVNDTAKGLKKVFDPTCLNTLAMGDRFWARRKPQDCLNVLGERYEVIASVAESTITQSSLLRFKLKNNLTLAGQSTAIEVTTGAAYTETGVQFTIKDAWNMPGQWREDLPSHAAGQGYKGWCLIPPFPELDGGGNPIREIVYMEHIAKFIEFTLVENMGQTIANQALISSVTYYFGKDPADVFDGSLGREFFVHDRSGLFPLALNGAKGQARYDERTHKYIFTACDQMAILCRATLTGAMCPNDDASISNIAHTSWAPYGQLPAPAPTTAKNYFKLSARSGSSVFISYNKQLAEWFVIQVQHEEAYLGNILSPDYANCQINYFRKKYSLMACDDEFITDTLQLTRGTVLTAAFGSDCSLGFLKGNACFFDFQNDGSTVFPMTYTEFVQSVDVSDCTISFTRGSACVWSAGTAAGTSIVFESVEVVTDISSVDVYPNDPSQGCKLEATTKYACVLSSEEGFKKDALVFTRQQVVIDVYRDTSYGTGSADCLVQDRVYISVPCQVSGVTDNSIICFKVCP